jgi:hypothetical protein
MGSRHYVGLTLLLQSAHAGRANHTSMACYVKLGLSAHLACSVVGVIITDYVV